MRQQRGSLNNGFWLKIFRWERAGETIEDRTCSVSLHAKDQASVLEYQGIPVVAPVTIDARSG
jgi:hypothetical protein